MRNRILFAAVAATLLASSASHAGLLGEQVTGVLKFGSDPINYFDPANLLVPTGFLNASSTTVVIADPDQEFGFDDGGAKLIADFTDGQLSFTFARSAATLDFTMSFTFAAGLLQSITELSDTFPDNGLNAVRTGDTIAFSWAGNPIDGGRGTFLSTYNVTTTNTGGGGGTVPEPNVLALAGLGLLALGLARKRKA